MTSNKAQDDTAASHEEIDALVEQLKRAQADFVNLKRRTTEEQASLAGFARAQVLLPTLKVFDTFRLAVEHVPATLESDEWVRGVLHTVKQFEATLTQLGVTTIPATGEPVDPELHEAVAVGPGEKDVITEELERGYFLGDTVIRPAKVRVGDGTA